MNNMKKIVVAGSANPDMIINVPRIPQPGETVLGGRFSMAAGGKGANQAVAAARAGGQVCFIARVGNDTFGEQAIAGYRAAGIDIGHVRQDDHLPSGIAEIFVAGNGENSIAVAPGANANLTPADIQHAADKIAAAAVLLLQLESPLESVIEAAKIAHEHGIPVILNPAPAQALPDELCKYITYLTPNESELRLISGSPTNNQQSIVRAAKSLLNNSVRQVIVTLGSRGSLAISEQNVIEKPAYVVAAVDTTAAGDVFNGALAVALTENKNIDKGIMFASAAAAISVTRPGAQPSAPNRNEIEKFIREHGD